MISMKELQFLDGLFLHDGLYISLYIYIYISGPVLLFPQNSSMNER
jgi:hypothetical protein